MYKVVEFDDMYNMEYFFNKKENAAKKMIKYLSWYIKMEAKTVGVWEKYWVNEEGWYKKTIEEIKSGNCYIDNIGKIEEVKTED